MLVVLTRGFIKACQEARGIVGRIGRRKPMEGRQEEEHYRERERERKNRRTPERWKDERGPKGGWWKKGRLSETGRDVERKDSEMKARTLVKGRAGRKMRWTIGKKEGCNRYDGGGSTCTKTCCCVPCSRGI